MERGKDRSCTEVRSLRLLWVECGGGGGVGMTNFLIKYY